MAPDSIRILLIERIFHEKKKIKVLAEGDRAKLIERDFHAQKKITVQIERAFHK